MASLKAGEEVAHDEQREIIAFLSTPPAFGLRT
jgi:hypothetical protein